ncbi:MAG: HD domain-containing protein [candidate division Zixibacteria bacterium]|nr:HD domain-containing protein [candidate division Zixibacteria bacterium]
MKLAEIKIGDNLLGYYALRTCELIPHSNGVRLKLELADSSGRMAGIMWDDEAKAVYPAIKDAAVVKVKGLMSLYQGRPQVQVEKIRAANSDEYEAADFLPVSSMPTEQLEVGISKLIESISDQEIKRLTLAVIFDEEIKPLYFLAPGGTTWHHPYVGGLAEHSLSMATAAALLCEHYTFLDRSLMVAGALLHDVGKINELEVSSTLSYSVAGRLYGHIVMGYELVKAKAVELEIAEDENVKKLLHMILSHQGKKEFSVPVEPCFEEAFALYFLDEIDSKLNAITRIRNKPENEGKDFSGFVKILQTYLYLNCKSEIEEEQ